MANETLKDGGSETKTVSLRLGDEERAALQYVCDLFGTKYEGISSVLRDYSVNQAVDLQRRALALAESAS